MAAGRWGAALYRGEVSYDFVGRRRRWYAVSGLILVLAVVGLSINGLNRSVEFKGGDVFELPSNGHSVSDARDVITGLGIKDPIVTKNSRGTIRIETVPLSAVTEDDARRALADAFGVAATAVEPLGPDSFQVLAGSHTAADATTALKAIGFRQATATLSNGNVQVETGPPSDKVNKVQSALADAFGLAPKQVDTQEIGPSWGHQITNKAIKSLIVFMVLVIVFISLRFEWKMAIAAVVALIHDLLITVGVYALFNFVVSPATVIGLLTILGYSLYDTVVVFDKVRENTAGLAGGNRMTYSQAANLAVNQTLVRSINTSIIALLPVAGILFIGAYVLGAGTLKDLSLALFVGIAAGAYSSIFIATPLLASFKEREPQMQLLARRVQARVAAGKPAGAIAGGATAAAASGAATATAVLEREDDESATAPSRAPAAGATPPRRPPQRRRTSRRGGRPGGRKRR